MSFYVLQRTFPHTYIITFPISAILPPLYFGGASGPAAIHSFPFPAAFLAMASHCLHYDPE